VLGTDDINSKLFAHISLLVYSMCICFSVDYDADQRWQRWLLETTRYCPLCLLMTWQWMNEEYYNSNMESGSNLSANNLWTYNTTSPTERMVSE